MTLNFYTPNLIIIISSSDMYDHLQAKGDAGTNIEDICCHSGGRAFKGGPRAAGPPKRTRDRLQGP